MRKDLYFQGDAADGLCVYQLGQAVFVEVWWVSEGATWYERKQITTAIQDMPAFVKALAT